MMAHKYERFTFCSAPRTGSTWFIKAMAVCGLGAAPAAHIHAPVAPDCTDYSVSLIRHPYDWLESYYYALDGGLIGVPEVDEFALIQRRSHSFEQFVREYLDKAPGQVWRAFASYPTTTVLRLEDFPWNVAEFLQSLYHCPGISQQLRGYGPQNNRKTRPAVNKDLRREVIKAEDFLCDFYEYW